jgi:hypothetical protein
MINISPIKTEYAGIIYRSRLEARWAYFFDCSYVECGKCKVYYEEEGFNLDGVYYLPDFHLVFSDGGHWYAEIKPLGGVTPESIEKCRRLSFLYSVVLIEGLPGNCKIKTFDEGKSTQRDNFFGNSKRLKTIEEMAVKIQFHYGRAK